MNADRPTPRARPPLAVVSGGGTGLGRAIAGRFVASGYEVVIVGRREAPLAETAAELGPSVSFVAADLSSAHGAELVAASLGDRAVDVIVANAGGSRARAPTSLIEMETEWLGDLRNNLLTAVLLEYALRPLLVRPGGRVIGIGSIAAQLGSGFEGSYGAAKAGLTAWMYSLARELGPDGVTVNLVAPGFVPDTEFFGDRIDTEFSEIRIKRALVDREGHPDEVADAVHFLASPQAGYITAQILGVSGGTVFGR